jgi:DNA-binding FrmR family transcriptional regulator
MDAKCTRSILERLRCIEEQIRGIQRVVTEDRYCTDLLTQTGAAVEDLTMESHLGHCVARAMERDNDLTGQQKVDELLLLIGRSRKQG